MKIPDDVRESLFALISAEADQDNWIYLPDADKSAIYTRWARRDDIGGVLLGFMGPQEVHKYLKDTLVKNYVIRKMESPAMALSVLRIPATSIIQKSWIKPHGVSVMEKGVIAWSAAQDWKTTILAVFERALKEHADPYGVVLFNASGKFAGKDLQGVGNNAAKRLGIETVVWVP